VPTYPDAAQRLLATCDSYLSGEVDLLQLKAAVWETADTVVDVSEGATRRFLQAAEGDLDVIEHTTDTERTFEATLSVVEGIKTELKRYLSPDD
jgi:hypothetical protein